MKQSFEKEFSQLMGQKTPVSQMSRVKFDQAYEQIRQQQVTSNSQISKRQGWWPRLVVVAIGIILLTTILAQQPVIAKLQDLLGFNSEWKRGLAENIIKENQGSVSDQGIIISLTENLSTRDAIGFSYRIVFENTKLLEGAQKVNMDYRIKNGNGQYLVEFIPDTKAFKGDQQWHSQYINEMANVVKESDSVSGTEQYISYNDTVPLLKGAVLEIESVRLFYEGDQTKIIEGQWVIPLEDGDERGGNSLVVYEPQANNPDIIIHQAEVSATKMTISFSVIGKSGIELETQRFHVKDQSGKMFKNNSYQLVNEETQPVIVASFPLTNQEEEQILTLYLDDVGEVVLQPKK